MTYDEGLVTICELENIAPSGALPRERLVKRKALFFGDRTVGFSRQYAAKGVNEQVDRLILTWREHTIHIGMYAVTEDGEQYRIDNVQHLLDDDGLKITDLTLRRLDQLYDVTAEA